MSLGPGDGSGPSAASTSRRSAAAGGGGPSVRLLHGGGTVLRAPTVRLVAPAGSPRAERLEAYLAAWAKSPAYAEQLGEYGVGALRVLPAFNSSYAWPSHSYDADRAVGDDLPSNVEAALAEAYRGAGEPALEDDALLVVLVPEGVSVSLSGEPAASACNADALSWHAATDWLGAARPVPYVVVSACSSAFGLSADETAAALLSHALIGALTNPLGNGLAGAVPESPWSLLDGPQEAPSLCAAALAGSDALLARPAELPLPLMRSWSNARSEAGLSPCVPAAGGDAFVRASVAATEPVAVSDRHTCRVRHVQGISMAQNEVVELPVALASGAATGPVQVAAKPLSAGALSAEVEPMDGAADLTRTLRLSWLSEQAGPEVLVRLTSRHAGGLFHQYLLVSRTPP